MQRPFITFTSDLSPQSEGIGLMHGVVVPILPEARIVHLAHGLPSFQLSSAARALEAVYHLPVGYHVCVVAPGVGKNRRGLIIKVRRGDFLIGPDNGVLLPAAAVLGGIEKVVLIADSDYIRQPVSPVFHGRDVYAPIAAHLARGVSMDECGSSLDPKILHPAPYGEAMLDKNVWQAQIIHVNHYGNCQLNISEKQWQAFAPAFGDSIGVQFEKRKVIRLEYHLAFGEVVEGQPLAYIDELNRLSFAVNLGSFAEEYESEIGDSCLVWKGIEK